MIWDKVAGIYDAAETIYNRKVYLGTGKLVAEELDKNDIVLECACGTGSITRFAAAKCRLLAATDLSLPMLAKAQKNCSGYDNILFRCADMTHLDIRDDRFDKVIAGNVIHLLDDPEAAIKELERVCKSGGKLIIPTYINEATPSQKAAMNFIAMLGVDFKSSFDMGSYKRFFADMGYDNVEYKLSQGRMSCAIAVININK